MPDLKRAARRIPGVRRLAPIRSRLARAPGDRAAAPSTAPAAAPGGPPRIGLVGFYGWGNYGDELFHEVYREHLGGIGELTVLHDTLARPYFQRPVLDAVSEVDAIIIGGGDLVIPWQMSQLYWRREYLRRPVFISGVGVPMQRKPRADVVERLRAFFQHPNVRWISARDPRSAEWIEQQLQPSVPVVCSPDLVCALTLPPAEPTDDVLGIVTRFRPGRSNDYAPLRALAERGIAKGMRIRHIVLATGQTGARDLQDAALLDVPGKELVHSESLDALSTAIGECRVLATMKFHGAVVAAMYRVPGFSLSTTLKNRTFAARLGRPELSRSFVDENLADILDPLPARHDAEVIAELRSAAVATLGELRTAVAAAAAEARQPA